MVGFSRRPVAGSVARGAEERPGAAVRGAGATGRQGDAAGAIGGLRMGHTSALMRNGAMIEPGIRIGVQ